MGSEGADHISLPMPSSRSRSDRPGAAVRQPGHADPPAAQGQALAQRGGDHGPLRCVRHRAGEPGGRVMHQVTVDLVGDDEQVVLAGHLAQRAHAVRAGQLAGRVVRQGQHDGADPAAGLPGGQHRLGQRRGVADPALAGRCGHEVRLCPDHGGLRGIADPARLGHGDVGADRQQQAEQQRLAARAADHGGRAGRGTAPGPVAGRGLAQHRQPGHRAIGVAAAGRGERVPEQRVRGQPGLAEGQRQHRLARPALAGQGLVGGQRGRHRDRRQRAQAGRSWLGSGGLGRGGAGGSGRRGGAGGGGVAGHGKGHGCISHGHESRLLDRGVGAALRRENGPSAGWAVKRPPGHLTSMPSDMH